MPFIKHSIFFLAAFVLILEGCSYKSRNILYKTPHKLDNKAPAFQYDPSTQKYSEPDSTSYKHRIKIGDRIQVHFLQNYDLGQNSTQSATSNQQNSGADVKGYLVNYDSTVTLPLVGRTNLCGLTRLEAAKKLEIAYSKHLTDPIIDIEILNLSVSVLGDVVNPGKYYVDKENTKLVEVIAMAGGFKDGSKKNTIQIIRDGQVIQVDMQKIETSNANITILHDNDIIYIPPFGIKADLEPITVASAAITPLLTVLQITLMSIQIYIMFQTFN